MEINRSESADPIAATEAELPLARESGRRLARYARRSTPLRIVAEGGKAADAVVLPASAVRLLVRLLAELADGNAVTLVPVNTELTTQQAADLLGVSRPFVIKQIGAGKLAHRQIGTHRRIMFADLMDYKRRMDADRLATLDELAVEGQRLKLG